MQSKSLLACGLLILSPLSSQEAELPLDFFARGNVSFQLADEGNGSFTELKSNSSRIGVKGEQALGKHNLTAFYNLEWGVDLANLSSDENITSRNQFIGLAGDFGKVLAGRVDTSLKLSQGRIDQFNDYEGDLKKLWKGDNRLGQSVAYKSPTYNGFNAQLTFISKGDEEGESGQSVAVTYGDRDLKKGAWYAAVAADFDVSGYDIIRAGAQTKMGNLKLGVMAQRQEVSEGGESQTGALISAAYKLDSDWTFKGQAQTMEDDRSYSVGADYQLGEGTKVYAWYTYQDVDASNNRNWLGTGLEIRL